MRTRRLFGSQVVNKCARDAQAAAAAWFAAYARAVRVNRPEVRCVAGVPEVEGSRRRDCITEALPILSARAFALCGAGDQKSSYRGSGWPDAIKHISAKRH